MSFSTDMPTLEVLFAPSVVGADVGDRFILNLSLLNTGTLGDGAFFYDITEFVRNFNTSRGRRRELERFTTGTAQIILDNRDRRFDPTNTTSPYYNATVGVTGIVPAIPVVIRATWEGTQYPVFRGFIDSWKFDYSDAGIGDATATITCSDAFKVLSNVVGGLPSVTTITSSGTGVLDVAVSTPSDGGGFGISSIEVVDETTTGNVNVTSSIETTPIIGSAGDLAGARINTILDAISWPQNLRAIDTGQTRLEVQNATKTVLELVNEAAQTDVGAVYVERDGTIVFDDRTSIISEDRCITSQATFDATTKSNQFSDVNIAYDDDLIYNIVRVNRKTTSASSGDSLIGTTVTIGNAESQSLYGARTLDLELPIPSTVGSDTSYGQSTINSMALFLASQYANPELRPDSITFKPRRDPVALWPQVLGRRLRDRITVKFAVPGGGSPVERDCFVAEVQHSGSPADWTTRFGLSSATFFTGFFILDNTGFGVLDTNKLSF
jgi:hypothetical protein